MKAPTTLPIFSSYKFDSRFYDEIFTDNNEVREVYEKLFNLFSEYSVNDFANLTTKQKMLFLIKESLFKFMETKKPKKKYFLLICFQELLAIKNGKK